MLKIFVFALVFILKACWKHAEKMKEQKMGGGVEGVGIGQKDKEGVQGLNFLMMYIWNS